MLYIYIQLYSHPGKNRASNVQKKQNSILWLLEDDYTIERRMSIIYHIAIYIYIIHGRLGYPIQTSTQRLSIQLRFQVKRCLVDPRDFGRHPTPGDARLGSLGDDLPLVVTVCELEHGTGKTISNHLNYGILMRFQWDFNGIVVNHH